MIEEFERAYTLPSQWDSFVGDNLYMKRDFLAFMEGASPCGQKYFAVWGGDKRLQSVFMTFVQEGYNLAMFTRWNLQVRITMVYVPLSVTQPGLVYSGYPSEALAYLKGIKGYKILLNLPDEAFPGFAKGLTCPKCILRLRWQSLDGYLAALRSGYRRRYQKALRQSAPLRLRWLERPEEFTGEMYGLYLQTVAKSRIKIETLPMEFFRGAFFKIFVLENDDGVQGFVQLLENGSELIFEFVGVAYSNNNRYDTYHRMLLEIIQYGIQGGFQTIDFGQTADDTKLKLGCDYTYLWAYLHHHNPLIQRLCTLLAPAIEYRPITTDFRVFREGAQ